jgi:transposase/IS5 family transposase
MAKKTFRSYDPKARVELPGDLRQYLPPDHQVFLIEDLVESLDLTPITSVYEQGDGRGQPPYHPVLLTKLLVYAYCEGESSSRRIMRKTYEDIAYRVLCVDQHPDFRTISDFRERHLAAFLVVFKDTVRLAKELGQVRLAHVAQDGSKILANASKHKAMSYERMGQTEARLGREIEAILAAAQETDAAEDARYGRDGTGDAVNEAAQREVDFRQARRARIRAAKAALEARAAAEAAAQAPVEPEQRPAPHLLEPEPPPPVAVLSSPPQLTLVPPTPVPAPEEPADEAPSVLPDPKAQFNFTDDESRIMPSKDGFVQAYNAQAAVDSYRQIIVACAVTNASNDIRQLQPMLDLVRQTAGRLPEQYSADTGYWSAENVTALEQRGVDAYIPPKRPPRRPDGSRSQSPPTPLTARMQAKLKTPEGKRTYSLRKETAEPVFGQMKDGRSLRRFRTRGLAKVGGEWALWCLTHNLRKLASVCRAQRVAARVVTTARTDHDPYLVVLGGLWSKIATICGVPSHFAPITSTTACGFAAGRPVHTVPALSATNARFWAAFTFPLPVSQTGS